MTKISKTVQPRSATVHALSWPVTSIKSGPGQSPKLSYNGGLRRGAAGLVFDLAQTYFQNSEL